MGSIQELPRGENRMLKGTDKISWPGTNIKTLPQLFQNRAVLYPSNVAYSCKEKDGLRKLTYTEANDTATRVAASIAGLCKDSNSAASDGMAPVVAIWLERGLNLLLSILSTAYSGATWLPLDPDIPLNRAATCISDSSTKVIICDERHLSKARQVQEQVGADQVRVVTFTSLEAEAAEGRTVSETLGPQPHDAAYLIYTSGTTGTPKGIKISQQSTVIFCLSEGEVMGPRPTDIVWNGASPAFDVFVEEMWLAVAGGAELAIGTRKECRDIPGLPAVWGQRGVTIVSTVPSLMAIVEVSQADAEGLTVAETPSTVPLPSSIRILIFGGETCPLALVERLARPGLKIMNTYGPTEATIAATWDEVHPGTPITIGRPLPLYNACILPIQDEATAGLGKEEPLELAEGAEGELAIGGPCVGLGYVGRPELTAQKFIPHPYIPSELLYKTGDRVRLDADLKILHIGRIDRQIKHRGFRIELAEIESQLARHSAVLTAAVILAHQEQGSVASKLEAFVVTRAEAQPEVIGDELRQHLSQHLPVYMQPDEIVFLSSEEMPRVSGGKVDVKSLHDLSRQRRLAAQNEASQ